MNFIHLRIISHFPIQVKKRYKSARFEWFKRTRLLTTHHPQQRRTAADLSGSNNKGIYACDPTRTALSADQ